MKRIVLHVGPEKCGSTSIQQALRRGAGQPDMPAVALMAPADLLALDMPHPAPEAVARINAVIDAARGNAALLVLSHEMIFKAVDVLRNLAAICLGRADEVVAVGFARRQSDFLVSGFGQWLFRSPERLEEARGVLVAQGLDPDLFRAVERHLIAASLGGVAIGRRWQAQLYGLGRERGRAARCWRRWRWGCRWGCCRGRASRAIWSRISWRQTRGCAKRAAALA
ncbi:MAG: hypothetical protein R3D85_11775 [Paracoccaceae bacterium]